MNKKLDIPVLIEISYCECFSLSLKNCEIDGKKLKIWVIFSNYILINTNYLPFDPVDRKEIWDSPENKKKNHIFESNIWIKTEENEFLEWWEIGTSDYSFQNYRLSIIVCYSWKL